MSMPEAVEAKTTPMQMGEMTRKTTFLGLHEWCCHLVGKFGWVVLCKKDDAKKVECYKESLQKFVDLTGSGKLFESNDKNNDVMVMHNLIKDLQAHLEGCREHEMTQTGGARRRKKSKSKSKSKSKGKKGRKTRSKGKAK
jgi:hypothetical protein